MSYDNPLVCVTCDLPLENLGTKKFHEGTRWGVLGQLGELLINRMHFDVFVCPRCGRVHAFLDGVGEEFRAHATEHAEQA